MAGRLLSSKDKGTNSESRREGKTPTVDGLFGADGLPACLTDCLCWICRVLHIWVVVVVVSLSLSLSLFSCCFLCPSRYHAAVSPLYLGACVYLDGVVVRRLLCSALSFTAVGNGILHVVRHLAWRVADTDTCHRKCPYAMRYAEAINARAASNNLHCYSNKKGQLR
jgi:hypothetical protein